jgi:hypothetical protein
VTNTLVSESTVVIHASFSLLSQIFTFVSLSQSSLLWCDLKHLYVFVMKSCPS